MKKQNLIFLFLFSVFITKAQVGIGTNNPDPSALLELSSTNKGLKGPSISLTSKTDQSTIPDPQTGLLVYNIANAGTFPNNVIANQYYFWNGTEWINLASEKQIEELLLQGLYVINDTTSQTFSSINDNTNYVVNFAATPILNKGNIVAKSGSIFEIQRTGLYELTAAVNYNPAKNLSGERALLNLIFQVQKQGQTTWTDIAGGRSSWGANATNYYQTAILPNTCVLLDKNDNIRLTITNPITGSSSGHGTGANINISTSVPISKSVKIQLINY